jgi:hypothetical protein
LQKTANISAKCHVRGLDLSFVIMTEMAHFTA